MEILVGREARDTDPYEGAQVDEDKGLRDLGERLRRQGVQDGVEGEEACRAGLSWSISAAALSKT